MAKQPQECGCGCKGMTKGGRFLPGHDARMHGHKKEEQRVRERMAGPVASGPIEFAPSRKAKDGTQVGAIIKTTTPKGWKEGIIYFISPFGWVAIVDQDGKQWVSHEWEVLEANPAQAAKSMTPLQKQRLARLTA